MRFALRVDQYIARFQVAVNDTSFMSMVQSVSELGADLYRSRDGDRLRSQVIG
jgi:hypothetical protein